MNYKLTFKEQLRWTLFGLGGILAPTLLLSHVTAVHPLVILGITLFINAVGAVEGYTFRGKDEGQLIAAQEELIDSSQELIREQRWAISQLKEDLALSKGPVNVT